MLEKEGPMIDLWEGLLESQVPLRRSGTRQAAGQKGQP